ncbi:PIN domain-containing protein [Candidatus Poribacteria bacterium]
MGTESENVCYCFIDTNIFLQYRSFTEIDWAKELEADRVVLVVCSTVLGELDEKKAPTSDNRRTRQRARDAAAKLADIDEKNQDVRANVDLLLIAKEPRIDWESEGLSSDVKDDRIIATILCERENMENLVIVTFDSAMRFKAKARDIRYHTISDEYLLEPSKSPEEKELEELRKLVARIPKLSLKLAGEEELRDFAEFSLLEYSPISDEDIGTQLNDENMRLHRSGWNPGVSDSEFSRYGRDLEKYLDQLEGYLEEKRNHDELCSRAITISFVVANDGTTPAEEIDIFLFFPDGFALYDRDSFPEEPEPPEEPTPMRDRWEMERQRSVREFDRLASIARANFPTRVQHQSEEDIYIKPNIRKNNGYEVKFSLPKVKHNTVVRLEPVYILFSSIESAKSFRIDYSIIADNIPKKIDGRVNVILSRTA